MQVTLPDDKALELSDGATGADAAAARPFVRSALGGDRFPGQREDIDKEEAAMADAGPPLVLVALGLVLWLAVEATLAGISIQTIGVILFVVGLVWLVIELVQSRSPRRAAVVRDEPVVRERELS